MKHNETDARVVCSDEAGIWRSPLLLILQVLVCAAALQSVSAQEQSGVSPGAAPLTTRQVVEELAGMNLKRAQALHSYHGTRIYRLEYRGFPGPRSAEMVVDVKFRAPGTKEFTIRTSTGSRLILDKVFGKLLEAEENAQAEETQRSAEETQRSIALNYENYDFTMVGYESTPSRSMYVLLVEPKTKNKFLYRGRVWVDADDFAVVRLEAEPAKNPSIWTKSSEIEQLYVKVGDFWLPKRNHCVSSIRLGGRAELTIDYQDYQITASDHVSGAPPATIARSADASHAQFSSKPSNSPFAQFNIHAAITTEEGKKITPAADGVAIPEER
jgi:hypothetical protein